MKGKKLIVIFSFFLLLIQVMGCMTIMAKKDLSVFSPGVSKEKIITEVGFPAWSGKKGTESVDYFKFEQVGQKVKVEVKYDDKNIVKGIKVHNGKELFGGE